MLSQKLLTSLVDDINILCDYCKCVLQGWSSQCVGMRWVIQAVSSSQSWAGALLMDQSGLGLMTRLRDYRYLSCQESTRMR